MVIHPKKKENLTESDRIEVLEDPQKAQDQGDRWTFTAVLPDSSFIHTIHTSERTLEQAELFIGEVKEKSDGQAPVFHSDCWFYQTALEDNYCTYESVPYGGRGRPANLKQLIDKDLCYVQVHKKRDKTGKIEHISTRIVLGDELKVLGIFDGASRCKTVNTDYVESRNGKYRKDNARLIRRTLCHSKKACFHDAQIRLLSQVFNYTRVVDGLKVLTNPDAKRFEQKYAHHTPAMAEKLIDRVLTLRELLFMRPKPLS